MFKFPIQIVLSGLHGLAALGMAMLLVSCFHPGLFRDVCTIFDGPFAKSTGVFESVFEDPGTIIVVNGSASGHGTDGRLVTVEQGVPVPAYANQAAVFLNGWNLRYSGSDQPVHRLGTLIGRIRIEPERVFWNAALELKEEWDGDKDYDWTYYYTVVAWNDGNLHAMVDQNDGEQFCRTKVADGADNFFFALNTDMTTALSSFPSFLSNPGFASGRTVAVLPRGFGFAWYDGHHLLQLAYNLDSSEAFINNERYYKGDGKIVALQAPPSARVGSGFVSWNSYAIMKDNSDRRNYGFVELVSGMGGSDVGIIQPPFRFCQSSRSAGGSPEPG